MEIFKELGDTPLNRILNELNKWWAEEDVPEDVLQARTALIKKKGIQPI